jgi:demethylmenaquinone methyltransferase/2-methoxy-6-polyprenyl-1,4-benzoquinol methylase
LLAPGTSPEGTGSEEQAARWVRGMFGRIAPRYDLLNHLLSMNIDRYWRAQTTARVAHRLGPGARAVDLCCGTGDLMLSLAGRGEAHVFGSDFCHPMLTAAKAKAETKRERCAVFEADALRLPLADASMDVITVAFGFRNLANYRQGLTEMLRVLRPGGMAAILEFSKPPNRLFAKAYEFYSKRILPALGGVLSGSRDAYTYLPESVRKFPAAPKLAEQMTAAGFNGVRFEYMTGGIVALHLGERRGAAGA